MKYLMLACLVSTSLLTGCAATVERGGSDTISIAQASKQNLAVTFKGNDKVVANEDWGLLQRTWANSLQAEAALVGYRVTETSTVPAPQPGVLMQVNVSNFRFLSPGARFGAGVMTGNAWVNSSVDFVDMKSGNKLGTRTYNTTSSAWEGVMSAMTEKQVQAIAKQIIADIKAAKAE
ncbi:hypothetical protein ACQKQA_21680 [Pseudomonas sp. NPDC089530]|uniref:hypothetical protein n=1 Tax=Pseudomonas sp. NPDC089530 TaxID=3390651 RepID=UPI003D00332E